MIGKTIFIAFFAVAVGVLAEMNEEEINNFLRQMSQREDLKSMKFPMQQIQVAGQIIHMCLRSQINDDNIQRETEEAKRNGTINNLIKKYCAKTPEVKTCIHKYGSSVTTFFNFNSVTFSNSTDEMLDFMCYNEGERISTFIAEGGPACIQDNDIKFNECMEKISMGPKSFGSPTMSYLEKICGITNTFFSCIEDVFKGCKSTYVQDTTVSLLRIQRKMYPC